MESLRYERDMYSRPIKDIRWLITIVLLSVFSVSGCSQDTCQDDTITSLSQQSLSLLDTTAVKDKSILYYLIAKDKDGKFDVREAVPRVIAFSDRINRYGDGVGMSSLAKELFRADIFVESRGDSLAKSTAGALWVGQFLKSTAMQYGGYKVRNGRVYDKRIDVNRSLDAAAKMHMSHYNEFGDWSLAFAAYHMGRGNMRKLRSLYQEATGNELCSFDQLYDTMPPQSVIDRLASKNDNTFGYWIAIRNASTLLRLYEYDRSSFDSLVALYDPLPYDTRGVVFEKLALCESDYICGHDDVTTAAQAWLLQNLDHDGFVCGKYDFEHYLHADVHNILHDIRSLYGKNITIACGFIPYDMLDVPIFVHKQQKLRLGSHSSGRTFDIDAPTNTYDITKKRIVWWSDYNRLEMALTLLRYQGRIVWCTESDPDNKKVLHFHVTVLPSNE